MKIESTRINNAINTIGHKLNSPGQRLILGATALATQPFIDFNNKKADEETRAVSVAKTIGKIIAGTLVGFSVRAGCIALTKNFSKYVPKVENGIVTAIEKKTSRDIFVPYLAKIKPNQTEAKFAEGYDKYVKNIGTWAATIAMVFTNFLIDAPLTKLITAKLTPVVKSKIESDKKEVKDAS